MHTRYHGTVGCDGTIGGKPKLALPRRQSSRDRALAQIVELAEMSIFKTHSDQINASHPIQRSSGAIYPRRGYIHWTSCRYHQKMRVLHCPMSHLTSIVRTSNKLVTEFSYQLRSFSTMYPNQLCETYCIILGVVQAVHHKADDSHGFDCDDCFYGKVRLIIG